VTPRGPLSLPPGGAHWYRLGGIPTPDPPTFWTSFELLSSWLEEMQPAPTTTSSRCSGGRQARELTEASGADVLYREYPLPHTIDPAVVPELRDIVRRATTRL